MEKSDLFELIDAVKGIMVDELPTTLVNRLALAGSQVENDTIPNRVSKWIAFLKKQDASPATIGTFRKFLEDNY